MAVPARVGVLAGVPLDSGRPSDPSLALGFVRVLRELEVARGFLVPRWLWALSGSCVKEGVCSCWAFKSQIPARAVQGPVPVVGLFPF